MPAKQDWNERISLSQLGRARDHGLRSSAWLISDTHFRHRNIAGYCGRPQDADEQMLENWHRLVEPDDPIVHLGDLALGQSDENLSLLADLPGKKFLLRGNHDRQSADYYRTIGFTLVAPFRMFFQGWTIPFTHAPHPELVDVPKHLNLHGHIHERLDRCARLINCCVEWTGYAPVRIDQLLTATIARLDAGSPDHRDVPLSYAEWLRQEYGGEILRSDTDRFRSDDARSTAREAYTRYRLAFSRE